MNKFVESFFTSLNEETDTGYEKAKEIFHVDVLNGTYKSATDICDDCEKSRDEFYQEEVTDEDALFTIDIKVGDTSIFSKEICAYVCYIGSYVITDSDKGSFYEPPFEVGYTDIQYSYVGLSGFDGFIMDQDGNDTSIKELAEKIPDENLRDLFTKYIVEIIEDAISNYIPEKDKHCENDWEN